MNMSLNRMNTVSPVRAMRSLHFVAYPACMSFQSTPTHEDGPTFFTAKLPDFPKLMKRLYWVPVTAANAERHSRSFNVTS